MAFAKLLDEIMPTPRINDKSRRNHHAFGKGVTKLNQRQKEGRRVPPLRFASLRRVATDNGQVQYDIEGDLNRKGQKDTDKQDAHHRVQGPQQLQSLGRTADALDPTRRRSSGRNLDSSSTEYPSSISTRFGDISARLTGTMLQSSTAVKRFRTFMTSCKTPFYLVSHQCACDEFCITNTRPFGTFAGHLR